MGSHRGLRVTRKPGEGVVLTVGSETIVVDVSKIRQSSVVLRIEASENCTILRDELVNRLNGSAE